MDATHPRVLGDSLLTSLGETFGKIVRRRNTKPKVSLKEKPPKLEKSRVYLKAMPLRNLSDLDAIKREVDLGNILILKVRPLADKSVDEVRKAVDELCSFAQTAGGDIARLGEERIVITPVGVQIWRGRDVSSSQEVPTAA